jgi:nucleotide-binding universal stress UspA family protein
MNIANILMPTDFSDTADRAFVVAIDLAQAFDAKLHLLNVYDIPDTATVYEVTFPDSVIEGIKSAASVKLEALMTRAKANGIVTSSDLVFGSPSQIIVESAKHSKADLIVIGTRGQSGVKRFFMGSVAERTLRSAPCPVLTVGGDHTDNS